MSDYMLTAEEVRLRGRRRRRLLLVLALILGLAVAIAFGAKPVSHAVKAWQARRHAATAFTLIDTEQWNEARTEAVAAIQLWPEEPEALRAVARLLSRTRQPQALEFWRRLREKQRPTPDDLRDEASIALVAGETARAEKVCQELLAQPHPSAADWILKGQIALRNGAPDDARATLEKVQQDPKATEREQLQGALLALAVANYASSPEAAKEQARSAWAQIEKISRGTTPASLEALIVLARQILTAPREQAPPITLTASEISGMLDKHPLAQITQKLIALDLLEHEDPSQRQALIERGITKWKEAEPADLAALATWLNSKSEFQKQLDAIPLEKAVKNRDLFLQHLDALGALGRWDEIKRLLEVESFPLDPVVQFMYLARCNAQLGEKRAAENNWQRALEVARGDIGKLITLAEYAEKNGANEVAESAYVAAATAYPKFRIAQQGRLGTAQASGDEKKIHAVLQEMLAVWPNDTAIQNDEAYLRLLRLSSEQRKGERRMEPAESQATSTPSPKGERAGGSESKEKGENGNEPAATETQSPLPTPDNQEPITDNQSKSEELIAIERLAVDLVKKEPTSLPHRTLLALSRLWQNRPAAALEVYSGINVPPKAVSPSALAVHAAVLAANGNTKDAQTEAAQVPLEKLLPEERGLIAALVTSDQ